MLIINLNASATKQKQAGVELFYLRDLHSKLFTITGFVVSRFFAHLFSKNDKNFSQFALWHRDTHARSILVNVPSGDHGNHGLSSHKIRLESSETSPSIAIRSKNSETSSSIAISLESMD